MERAVSLNRDQMCTQKIVEAGTYTVDEETKIGTYDLSNGSSGSSEEVPADSVSVSASQVKATLGKALAALARRVARLEEQLEGRDVAREVCTWVRSLRTDRAEYNVHQGAGMSSAQSGTEEPEEPEEPEDADGEGEEDDEDEYREGSRDMSEDEADETE